MLVGQCPEDIYIARICAGISMAGTYLVVPLYIAEIVDSEISGMLSSIFPVVVNFGILMEFVAAEYIDYRVIAAVMAIVSVVATLGTLFLHDSPQFLLSKKHFERGKQAFKFYSGIASDEALTEEMNNKLFRLRSLARSRNNPSSRVAEQSTQKALFEGIKNSDILQALRALLVSTFPLATGCIILTTYNHELFEISGDYGPWRSILFAIFQLAASWVVFICVDIFGRRVMLCYSSVFTALFLSVFSGFIFIKTRTNIDTQGWDAIPIIAILLTIFASSMGMVPIPSFFVVEMLHIRVC